MKIIHFIGGIPALKNSNYKSFLEDNKLLSTKIDVNGNNEFIFQGYKND